MPNSCALPPVEYYQAHPSSELSSLMERGSVADRSHDRGRDQGPDTRDLPEPQTCRITGGDLLHFRFRSTTCWSRSFHSFQSRESRCRIRGVRSSSAFSSTSGMRARSLAGLFAKTRPRSSKKARSWLITDVRRRSADLARDAEPVDHPFLRGDQAADHLSNPVLQALRYAARLLIDVITGGMVRRL
jgi:hypothetical protein